MNGMENIMNKKIVVDASVVIEWFNDEKGSEEAIKLFGQALSQSITLIAPSLLLYEIGNIFLQSGKSSQQIDEAIELIKESNLQLKNISFNELSSILDRGAKDDLTFYDAAYLSLAIQEKADLWTADKKLSQAGKSIRTHLIS